MSDVIWAAIIALGTSVVGWGLATWWQSKQTRLENQRQHYYRTLEKTGEILEDCSDLADLVYQYHQACKESINKKQSLPAMPGRTSSRDTK